VGADDAKAKQQSCPSEVLLTCHDHSSPDSYEVDRQEMGNTGTSLAKANWTGQLGGIPFVVENILARLMFKVT
jgi:hypothetical protein